MKYYSEEKKLITGNGPMDAYNHSYPYIDQLQLFQKLYEWHFWLEDQSRLGQDIIDINTLNFKS